MIDVKIKNNEFVYPKGILIGTGKGDSHFRPRGAIDIKDHYDNNKKDYTINSVTLEELHDNYTIAITFNITKHVKVPNHKNLIFRKTFENTFKIRGDNQKEIDALVRVLTSIT